MHAHLPIPSPRGYVTQVIEVFSEWCGPSKGVVNALKKICFDHSESKVKFYAACADTCDACAKFKGKCTPAFLFIKDGRVVGEVRHTRAGARASGWLHVGVALAHTRVRVNTCAGAPVMRTRGHFQAWKHGRH